MYFIGIDLGTSAVKLLLADEKGHILNQVTKEYPLSFPKPGWSEQNPADWWNACLEGVPQLLEGFDASLVAGIGSGGQMHGLVVLDRDDNIIRPAILWNDGRTAEETEYLNTVIGKKKMSEMTANIAFAGFTAPKLLWMRKQEPENFAKISKIMLPKDYVNYRLTGVHSCDLSDAGGILLLDVKNRRWSPEMLAICGIEGPDKAETAGFAEEYGKPELPFSVLPKLFESSQVTGTLTKEAAELLGLPETVKVVAGAGDNAAAAVGTGTVGEGGCNISLGTSGTIFISSRSFKVDPCNALHAFPHADGGYHLMGVVLSAASCNKWLCDGILGTKDYAAEQAPITDEKLGNNSVFFLPYLMGERSPINDTNARGTFIGLSMDTSRADMVQAVLEGVAFGIRDSFEIAKSLGIEISRSCICGGGSASPLWRKIMASVLNIPLDMVKTEQGPGYGAVLLAMTGCGLYSSVEEAAKALVEVASTTMPDPALVERYNRQYKKFSTIYPALKDVYPGLLPEA